MVLTVDEAKQHLRIEYDEEDELIEKLIAQAQAAAEDFPHRTRGGVDGDDEHRGF